MVQYPEKSNQWDGLRYDIIAILHPIGRIFRILCHIFRLEFCEAILNVLQTCLSNVVNKTLTYSTTDAASCALTSICQEYMCITANM